MIRELENLVRLQRCDVEIHALESRLKAIPEQIADLQREVATERANVKSAEERLSECKRARRTLEGELELLETKINKYKDQLMQVKSNDEYRAMQKQIQTVKDDISAKEDMILVKMEEGDALQQDLRERKGELEQGLAHVRKLEGDLQAEASRLQSELELRQRDRDEIRKVLPANLLKQYQQISKVRGGVAVAEAKDDHCQECNVRLRPQVYQLLRIGDSIQRCDNCSRILYFEAPQQEERPSESKG